VGKDQEIKVMKEINGLQEFENDVGNPGRERGGVLRGWKGHNSCGLSGFQIRPFVADASRT